MVCAQARLVSLQASIHGSAHELPAQAIPLLRLLVSAHELALKKLKTQKSLDVMQWQCISGISGLMIG